MKPLSAFFVGQLTLPTGVGQQKLVQRYVSGPPIADTMM